MDEWNSNFSFCELPRNWENLAMCTKNLQKLCPTDLCSIKSGSIRFHFKNFGQTQSAPGWLVLPKIARKHPKIKKIIQGLGSEGWGRQGGRVPRQIPPNIFRGYLRAACCNDHLYLCKIEKFDFLKLCHNKGFC